MGGLFMAPVFLAGALLATIPVIIHLLFQRRAPQVRFSTIRFLEMCVRKTSRRKHIENLLLLIFRMLLFGLLAVALAKPFIKSSLLGSSGPSSTVIILDNSYSMATTQQGVARFTVAKKVAGQLVAALALILAGIGPTLHYFTDPFGWEMSRNVEVMLGIPVVIIFVLGATNSLNLVGFPLTGIF